MLDEELDEFDKVDDTEEAADDDEDYFARA